MTEQYTAGDRMYDDDRKICPWCGHGWPRHDNPYGCEVDMGDTVVHDYYGAEFSVARGPCGCKATREDAARAEKGAA